MAKLKRTITTERETTSFATLEANRRWLGATKAQIAGIIEISVRTYSTWVTKGTTQTNMERIRKALHQFSEQSK